MNKRRARLLCVIFSGIVSADIVVKWMTHTFLPIIQRILLPYPYGGISVFETSSGINFSLNHQINTGAAWGIFPHSHQTLFYVRLTIIAILLIYTLFYNPNRKTQIPFIFIIAGAVGNVLDTIFYGYVIDMFFFQIRSYDFPIFNIADTFIFLGVVQLCIINVRKEKKTLSREYDDSPPPSAE